MRMRMAPEIALQGFSEGDVHDGGWVEVISCGNPNRTFFYFQDSAREHARSNSSNVYRIAGESLLYRSKLPCMHAWYVTDMAVSLFFWS